MPAARMLHKRLRTSALRALEADKPLLRLASVYPVADRRSNRALNHWHTPKRMIVPTKPAEALR